MAAALCLSACARPPVAPRTDAAVEEWPSYGNDPGSSRYSPLHDIDTANVANLRVAWTYRTGDVSDGKGTWNGQKIWAKSTFEDTPLMADGTLYIATPFNRIIALDAETGKEKWTFDPHLERIGFYGDDFTCRGLARRVDPQLAPGQPCRKSLYEATLDGRLVAVDAETGKACPAFGTAGQVSLKTGINLSSGIAQVIPGEYHFTSAPAVVSDIVVVGSAINDNDRVEMPSGVVRGYDARTGALVWAWDPVPRDPADPARGTWLNGADRTGAANVWGPLSSDPAHDLVFLPTTSPSPDYFGGQRQGAGRYADSVVALRASTGKVVWSFQAVHHNLWDYDLPSAPSLIEVVRGGKRIAALAQPSKMGHLFILDRDTGDPVLPVEERPVPQGGVPGEWLSPTQPIPVDTPRLVPDRLEPRDAWGLTPWDRGKCSDAIAGLRRGGIFTPPSLQGTLQYPGNVGGTNWGGVSFDRSHGLIVVNQTQPRGHRPIDPARPGQGTEEPFRRRGERMGIRSHEGDPLRHAAQAVALSFGSSVQSSALGNPGSRGCLHGQDSMAGSARDCQGAGPRSSAHPLGHSNSGRPADHGRRPHLHRRHHGQHLPRVRYPNRARVVAHRHAGLRHGHPNDLPGPPGRPPIRGGRGWRPRQSERHQAGGLRDSVCLAIEGPRAIPPAGHGRAGRGTRITAGAWLLGLLVCPRIISRISA